MENLDTILKAVQEISNAVFNTRIYDVYTISFTRYNEITFQSTYQASAVRKAQAMDGSETKVEGGYVYIVFKHFDINIRIVFTD